MFEVFEIGANAFNELGNTFTCNFVGTKKDYKFKQERGSILCKVHNESFECVEIVIEFICKTFKDLISNIGSTIDVG